jgi:hypothetical protein
MTGRSIKLWTLCVILGTLGPARQAAAVCEYEGNAFPAPQLHCYPPAGWSGPVRAEIGSDPDDGYSQWIRWTKLDSNYQPVGCEWDGPLCWDTNINDWCQSNPHHLMQNLFVQGDDFPEQISTLGAGNVFGCDYNLTAPVCDGHEISLWGGNAGSGGPGSSLHLSNACPGTIRGSYEDDLITSDRAALVEIYGDWGNDQIYLYNHTSAVQVFSEQGNDTIFLTSSNVEDNPWYQGCGAGDYDVWYGASWVLKPGDCEVSGFGF